MTLPVPVKSWAASMLVNQRITFVSLLTTMGSYITGITNQQIAKGYTCSGSSDGTTAAMDGVNRCTLATGFAVRGAVAASAQSWIVVSDGVTQTLFAFQGASDDIARVSFSPGSLFVVAGTATNQPTATDEQVISATSTLIGSTASADRVFTVWVDSTHRMWRAAIFRSSVLVGPLIGVELYDSSPLISPATAPVPVCGFCQSAGSTTSLSNLGGSFSASLVGAVARLVVSSAPINAQLGGTYEIFFDSNTATDGVNCEAQGSVPLIRPLGFASVTTGAKGKIGNRIDWYHSSDTQVCGATTTGKEWIFMSSHNASTAGGVLWPWDNTSVPVVA